MNPISYQTLQDRLINTYPVFTSIEALPAYLKKKQKRFTCKKWLVDLPEGESLFETEERYRGYVKAFLPEAKIIDCNTFLYPGYRSEGSKWVVKFEVEVEVEEGEWMNSSLRHLYIFGSISLQ